MNVSFNNLRVKAMQRYNTLALTLNEHIVDDDLVGKQVIIDVYDIQKIMDEMRQLIILIGCCEDEGNPDFVDVSDRASVSSFNPPSE